MIKDALKRALGARRPDTPAPPGLTRASVLVPVLGASEPRLLFIERTTNELDPHSGQMSFPGGRREPADADAVATALREAQEELGVPRGSVEVLGTLGEIWTPTGFAITPVVGWIEDLPPLKPQALEVAGFFEVPLSELSACRPVAGRPEYRAGGRRVWGATARITAELLELINPES